MPTLRSLAVLALLASVGTAPATAQALPSNGRTAGRWFDLIVHVQAVHPAHEA